MFLPIVVQELAYYRQIEKTLYTDTLVLKDKRLNAEIAAREFPSGSIKNLSIWIKGTTQLTLATTEVELNTTKDYFVFKTIRAGHLMEAYSTLYRMRWIAYKSGKPNYELSLAKDQLDNIYAPQNDQQKERFAATASFMSFFDKMDGKEKAEVLSGKPLEYSKLPEGMQSAFKSSINAAIEIMMSSAKERGRNIEKPEIDNLTEASISLSDKSQAGTGVREMWISSETNLGSYSFRWNDYNPKKTQVGYSRPTTFIQEPESAEIFSREQMLQRFKKLSTLPITVPESERTLSHLLKYLSDAYGINFITNEDKAKQSLVFACKNLPLASALDKICQQYGDWEWEASPGEFIIMRSRESPQRRHPAPGHD